MTTINTKERLTRTLNAVYEKFRKLKSLEEKLDNFVPKHDYVFNGVHIIKKLFDIEQNHNKLLITLHDRLEKISENFKFLENEINKLKQKKGG